MKIKSLLLLLFGCAGMAFSSVAIIDFGTGLNTNNPYGNQIIGVAPPSSYTINDLLAIDAKTPTGWTLTVTGLRANGPSNTCFTNSWWSSSKNSQDFSDFSKSLGLSGDLSFDVWGDNAALSNTGSTVFSLSGLTPGKEYIISFGLGRNGGGGTTTIKTSKGTLESGNWVFSSGNKADSPLTSLGFVNQACIASYKIAADANGEIAFDFSTVQYGAVNFMTVALPEPSGAMLGMVGMVGFLFRRKR